MGSTSDLTWSSSDEDLPPPRRPGVIVLFTAGHAAFEVHVAGKVPLVLGRDPGCDIPLEDSRCSRRHAEVALENDQWKVRDLGSRNGTLLEADRRRTSWPVAQRGVLALGDTICLLLPDVGALVGGRIEVKGDLVLGPRMQAVWREIARAAANGTVSFVGETGSGKELAARHFHDSSPRHGGPFIAVNCAAV